MRKLWLLSVLLPLSAEGARKDFSEYLSPQTRGAYTMEVDTDVGFYVRGQHGETLIPFGATRFGRLPAELDYPTALSVYVDSGGRFAIQDDGQGYPLQVQPYASLRGGGDGASGCRKEQRECVNDSNTRYDKAMEKCESKMGDKDRQDCRAEARTERDRDVSKCDRDTDKCYEHSERESRADGSNFGSSIGAGERIFDSLSEKIASFLGG
ncbi:MAG: hypothetical protein OXT67_10125 [Zetaproteobacteria bacterium]|nr:hypothetical protein [Zetaproteobacteria bacterium]